MGQENKFNEEMEEFFKQPEPEARPYTTVETEGPETESKPMLVATFDKGSRKKVDSPPKRKTSDTSPIYSF